VIHHTHTHTHTVCLFAFIFDLVLLSFRDDNYKTILRGVITDTNNGVYSLSITATQGSGEYTATILQASGL